MCLSYPGKSDDADGESGKISLSDGTGIYYRAKGSGRTPTLLFIHGWSCSSRYWERQFQSIPSRYHTVAIDLRGHGHSDKPSSGYTLTQMAMDLHEVMEQLDLRDLFMVGWSMGGSIVFEYLREFGAERLRGLCIVDASPYIWKSDDYPGGYADYRNRLQTACEYAMAYQKPSDEHATFVERMFLKTPAPAILDQLKADYRKVPPYVRSLLSLELSCMDYRPIIEEINLPVLIIRSSWHNKWRKDDPVGEWMHRKIKHSRLVRFTESGHCPFLEEPDRFNHALSEFIETVDSTTSQQADTNKITRR